ncbi:LPXTG cell wall anchor domain-containing protein [Streptococcus mitis]|uniref:LPXTG cell wall anchor domain-containing protein n=1 Tax=Streptococcus mitis TaxID=28037 RepID=UPI0021B6F26F|nr:LPXTG cell wall anchor domain-containing protein [Streptococcus mitis]
MKKWAKIITLSSIVVLASASAQIAYADTNTSQNENAITTVSPNTGTTTAPSNATTVPVVAPNAGTTTIPSSDTTVPAVAPNAGTTTIPSSDTTVPAVAPNTGTTTIPSSDTTVPAVSPNTGTTTAPSSDTTVPSVPTSPSEQPSVVAPTDPGTTVATGSSSETSSSSNSSSSSSSSATTPTSEDKNKKDNATSDNKVSVSTIDGGTTTLIPDVKVPTNNPGVSAQTAVEAGASQVGTTSQVTGQVVQEVSPSAPVQTETGASIVSTQNGNVVLSDGSVIAPEEVGGTVNEDKTISVKDKDGKLKTLPNTGLKESILLTFAGFGLLAIVISFFLKKRSN